MQPFYYKKDNLRKSVQIRPLNKITIKNNEIHLSKININRHSLLSKKPKNTILKEEELEKNNQNSNNNSKTTNSILNNIPIKRDRIKNQVFNILSKEFSYRSGYEIRFAAEYLSKNYIYFIDLKNNDSQFKVEKLTKICKLEVFTPGQVIILYGDIGDKFYIVLEGLVEIYKPEYIEETLTTYQYLKILNKIKDEDILKYERIKKKNENFYFETIDMDRIDPDTAFMRSKFNFFLEEEQKKGEYGEGFSFGEIALMKKTTRNATIRAVDNTVLLSISKDDYNSIMMEIEIKKLGKEIEIFKKNYQFFNCFDLEKMIQVYNCFNKITLYKGDFLCHQNDINDYIFIIINGKFEVFSYISFSWLNDYYKYIDNSLGNILFYMIKNKNMKYSELLEIISNIKEDSLNSPMKDLNYSHIDDSIKSKINEKDNLYNIKIDEEKVNDSKNIFKINLKKIDYNDLIGLEDSFEFKKKFYSVRCISSSAEVKCIKINDLIKIIWNFSNEKLLYLLKIIMNRKNILKNEIINAVKNLEKKILFQFDIRYEKLINYEDNVYSNKDNNQSNKISLKNKIKNHFFNKYPYTKKKENEVNRIVSAIKVKGYKMNIQDILDENINILPKNKSKSEKKLYRIKSSINTNILKNLLNQKYSNFNEFKFKKNISNLSDTNETNNNFTIFSANNSKIKTNYTHLKNKKINSFRAFSGFNSNSKLNKYNYSQFKKRNNIFKLKNINNFSENSLFKDIDLSDKDLIINKYDNIIINNTPKIRNISGNKPNLYLRRNSKNKINSTKNDLKMKKSISFNKNNINLIKNEINTVTKSLNKKDDIYYSTKKGLFNNFIKNKYNKLRSKININLSNEESIPKEKSKEQTINDNNNTNKDNIVNNSNNVIVNNPFPFEIKKKTYFYSNELKLDFQRRYTSHRKSSHLRTIKFDKK